MTSLNYTPKFRLLRWEHDARIPNLFYDLHIHKLGFNFLMTDLVYMWSCCPRRDSIVQHARDQNCSIDPSESDAQFVKLLSKLRDSVESGNNVISSSRMKTEGELELQTAIALPSPLQPLRWVFAFVREDQVFFGNAVTLPAIEELSSYAQQHESLLKVIKEKDHLISKLLDKIEGSSIDLSLIFPGITGLKPRKHHVSVDEASKHVPGMSTFDYSKWGAENAEDSHSIRILSAAVNSMDAKGGIFLRDENWKEDLGRAIESHEEGKLKRRSAIGQTSYTKPEISSSSNYDDFETKNQASISHTKHQDNTMEDVSIQSSDSDSEDRLKQAAKGPRNAHLGKLRSKKTAIASSETHSDTSSDSDTLELYSGSQPNARSKLGIIGGKRKTMPPKPPSPASEKASPKASTPSRRLGILGGEKSKHPIPVAAKYPSTTNQKTEPEVSDHESDDTPSPTQQSPRKTGAKIESPSTASASEALPGPPKETVQEAAARRRVELKRTLNSEGTSRKKRKF